VALSIVAELVQERASAAASDAAEPAGHVGPAGSAGATASGAAAPVSVPLGQATPVPLAIDPVCGMSVAAIPASLHVDTDAGTFYFCSEGCRKAFLANPERYAVAS
jgi:xanthine dehydrogenase accessory factor